MLAGDDVRPVLLDAAGGDNHRIDAAFHRIADFHPGQIFDEYRVNCLHRPRRIRVGGDRIGRGGQEGDGGNGQACSAEHVTPVGKRRESCGGRGER